MVRKYVALAGLRMFAWTLGRKRGPIAVAAAARDVWTCLRIGCERCSGGEGCRTSRWGAILAESWIRVLSGRRIVGIA